MRQAGINVVSTQDLVPDEELPNMGNAAIGVITAGNYSVAADRPANKAFLDAWNKAYGDKSDARISSRSMAGTGSPWSTTC